MPTPTKARIAACLLAGLILSLLSGSGCTLVREEGETVDMPLQPAPFDKAVLLGHLENQRITEASGMVASRKNPDILWIVNDGGDAPTLYAVDMQGVHRGHVRIRNALNVDWEDLAAYRINNLNMLLIADFGDNHARRETNDLYFVREPDIGKLPHAFDITLDWHHRLRFVYEDGPRDCESVAVDPDANQILLLTKRTTPPVLYSLSLVPDGTPPVIVARRLVAIGNMLPAPANLSTGDLRFRRFRSQPTAMDISPDGSEIVILTYGSGAYLYRKPPRINWTEGFRKSPQWIALPALRQAEALCFSADGQSLLVTSEQLPAPLYRLDRIAPLHGRQAS